ncbi:hypothetical protein [Litchfieldia salsa]|nr:hypothetical protein [Litchfieldia salsa]
MYKKLCNQCYRASFGSSETGEWFCPTCNQDLSQAKLYEPQEKVVRPFNLVEAYSKVELYKPSAIDLTV